MKIILLIVLALIVSNYAIRVCYYSAASCGGTSACNEYVLGTCYAVPTTYSAFNVSARFETNNSTSTKLMTYGLANCNVSTTAYTSFLGNGVCYTQNTQSIRVGDAFVIIPSIVLLLVAMIFNF